MQEEQFMKYLLQEKKRLWSKFEQMTKPTSEYSVRASKPFMTLNNLKRTVRDDPKIPEQMKDWCPPVTADSNMVGGICYLNEYRKVIKETNSTYGFSSSPEIREFRISANKSL